MKFNPGFQQAGFSGFPPSFPSRFQYRMAAFTSSRSPISSQITRSISTQGADNLLIFQKTS